jgi:uncharacterized protein (UPF0332 family)
MTLEIEDKKSLSNIRMEKAYKYLQDSKANYEENRYETSVNRSYYAALYAVRSILILEGADPETHKGAITLFSLRFVKPGLLAKDIVKKFELLLSRRIDVDYGDFETVDAADAEDSLKIANEIIGMIDKVRLDMIKNL